MKIAVNTRLLLKDKLEGIGWVAYETLRRMVKDHPEVEFYFIFDREPDSMVLRVLGEESIEANPA